MDFSSILNVLKLQPKVYFLIFIISGILLFSSDEFLVRLSLVEFKKNYNLWIGIVFLASLGFSVIYIVSFIIKLFLDWKEKKEAAAIQKQNNLDEQEKLRKEALNEQEKKEAEALENKRVIEELIDRQKEKLKALDNDEKAVLREFYILGKNTIPIVIDDPTVIGLINKGVIRQVGNQGYQTNFTIGIVAFFRADDITIEYFKEFNFPELHLYPRPKWVRNIQAQEAIEDIMRDLSQEIKTLSRM